MFGDYLRNHIDLLAKASTNKCSENSFWKILRRIAVNDILECYPHKVDSDRAVPIYYDILKRNEDKIPKYFCQKEKSDDQEKYRVTVRNLFTSNAFHPDGLANQKEIYAYKEINESKKGSRIVYQGVVEYVNRTDDN